jgi:hypothetical protein
MSKKPTLLLSTILILGLGFSLGASAQTAVYHQSIINFSGKIVSVDVPKSLVTIEGPEGRKLTFQVLNPDNLRAAKVGEPYNARFYEVTTIRKKKPGENLQGGSLSQGIWTTNPLGVPGGSRAAQVTLLVTVEAIDEANGTVTVKAADGTTETVKAREPQNLKLLKVGDELVISLYEAVAISLEKQSSTPGE